MITKLKTLNKYWAFLGMLLLGATVSLHAQDEGEPEAAVEAVAEAAAETVDFDTAYAAFMEGQSASFFTISNLWLLIAAALVFIMHLGFACVETGLTQSKNTVNILFKNVFIVCIGVITYAFWGFNSMYPGEFNGFFAPGSWFDVEASMGMMSSEYADYTWYTDFIFQAMFAATAATIVSGAVAERVKLPSFMLFATLLVGIAYPITGSWEWGGDFGWLNAKFPDGQFVDFAGSSLVHAFGGFAALACVIVLGPRRGKYLEGGKIKPIIGHSMPLATIGVFLLFLGWFGFNGGSVLNADPYLVSKVFVTTTLAACAGALSSIAVSWALIKKPDLSMALNGILAGLVGITAGADSLSPSSAIIVGLIAGSLVVVSILFFDKMKIDDPVGAISVHGVCGIFGTLAVAIFGEAAPFSTQLIGTLSISAFAFVFSLVVFGAIKAIMGVRVSAEEEEEGLDIGEHGQEAYQIKPQG